MHCPHRGEAAAAEDDDRRLDGEAAGGWGTLEVSARELAKLLGHFVFASQVIPGGRTYMQGMLFSFQGMEVDWRRGLVRAARGAWRQMEIGASFWRDLEWLDDHLERRNCVPLAAPQLGEAAIAGTDASGWGTGQLIWRDGGREETQLRFTAAEQRRPTSTGVSCWASFVCWRCGARSSAAGLF